MALALPTFIEFAVPLGKSSDIAPPRSCCYRGEPLFLKTFPQTPLTLPQASQVFSPPPLACDAIPRAQVLEKSIRYLTNALDTLGLMDANHPPRLLLVLPDKTRSPIAARLLIDTVLTVKAQFPALDFTLLFGLGTHPPMTTCDIEQHLGKARYQTLLTHNIPIHQQSTRDPRLPTQTVWVPKSEEMACTSFAALAQIVERHQANVYQHLATTQAHSLDRHLALEAVMTASHDSLAQSVGAFANVATDTEVTVTADHCPRHALVVPRLLWEHHLTIVAGDTDLHPYEGRGGSGGLHKMLTIALADLATIRLSHGTRILLDPQTRVGAGENAFVRILDQLAQALSDALIRDVNSCARSQPLGFSLLSLQNGDIHGFWWSQTESSRQQLTAVKQRRHTQAVSLPLHLVITEAELGKGTDMLAGARSLQYVADWDSTDNAILMNTPHQRVALLFNPCDEGQNHGGIGNHGTLRQLLVLQALAREHRHRLQSELSNVTNAAQCLNVIQHHRRETLSRWLHHLQLVSEMDDFLRLVGDVVRLIQTLIRLDHNPVPLQEDLQAILSIYSNVYSPEGRAIADLLNGLTGEDSLEALAQKLTTLSRHYGNTIGLGAGGQRALRLYRILQKFEALIIATKNATVLDFLATLDPDLRSFLPPPVAAVFAQNQITCCLLGIVAIDLNHHPCQTAVDCAINHAKFYNPGVPQPHIGFLPQPLILKRRC